MKSLITSLVRWNERFLNRRLNLTSRGLIVLGAVCLVASFFFPLWHIQLVAPQYPDGLNLFVYGYELQAGNGGQDLTEINLLNHYIGMQPIEEADFVEMTWIPFAIGFFVLFSLRNVVFGTMSNLIDNLVLYLYFSLFSLGNFGYRLYFYGHNLDPSAPMNPEPFMPALLGTKQIANFTQTSLPRTGTGFLIGFLVCLLLAVFFSRDEETALIDESEGSG